MGKVCIAFFLVTYSSDSRRTFESKVRASVNRSYFTTKKENQDLHAPETSAPHVVASPLAEVCAASDIGWTVSCVVGSWTGRTLHSRVR